MKISPTDARLRVWGALQATPIDGGLRFDRPILDEGGLGADAPGVRISLCTDAESLVIHLRRNGRHRRLDARNGTLLVTSDSHAVLARTIIPDAITGTFDWTVQLPAAHQTRVVEFHFPYGDSVDLLGFSLPAKAALSASRLDQPPIQWLAFGDSITQGFHASSPISTYPFLVAKRLAWNVFNAGIGGRCIEPGDGELLCRVPAEVVTVMLGFNDYFHQRPLAQCKRGLLRILGSFLARNGRLKSLAVITPLWSSYVGPHGNEIPLGDYRQAIASAAASLSHPALSLIEGETLVPAEPGLFQDGIHPNDRGFEVMAEQLASALAARALLTV